MAELPAIFRAIICNSNRLMESVFSLGRFKKKEPKPTFSSALIKGEFTMAFSDFHSRNLN